MCTARFRVKKTIHLCHHKNLSLFFKKQFLSLIATECMQKSCRSWRDDTLPRQYALWIQFNLVSKKWRSHAGVSILNSKRAIRFQVCVQHEALGKYVYIDCLWNTLKHARIQFVCVICWNWKWCQSLIATRTLTLDHQAHTVKTCTQGLNIAVSPNKSLSCSTTGYNLSQTRGLRNVYFCEDIEWYAGCEDALVTALGVWLLLWESSCCGITFFIHFLKKHVEQKACSPQTQVHNHGRGTTTSSRCLGKVKKQLGASATLLSGSSFRGALSLASSMSVSRLYQPKSSHTSSLRPHALVP